MPRLLLLVSYLSRFVYYRWLSPSPLAYTVLFQAATRLGGVYVKLMQFLSLRTDFIPDTYRLQFLAFLDQVPTIPLDVTAKIQIELGPNALAQFSSLEKTPFASGTFGQVYRGKLTNGQEVVVKIKRPGWLWPLVLDLNLITVLAWICNLFFQPKLVNVMGLIREFKQLTWKELDYQHEVANAQFMFEIYKDHPQVVIPQTYSALSNKSIITQDYVGGVAVTDLMRLKLQGIDHDRYLHDHYQTDLREVIKQLQYDVAWQGLMQDHFYSDPHPGNIKILPHNQYGLIDFGIMGESPKNKRNYYHLLETLAQSPQGMDEAALSREMLEFGAHRLARSLRVYDRFEYKAKTSLHEQVLHRYAEKIAGEKETFRQIEIQEVENYSKILLRLFTVGEQFRMQVPEGFFAVIRSVALIKSMTEYLEPGLHIARAVYQQIVDDVDESELLNYEDLNQPEPTYEEAAEQIIDWLANVAEVDVPLYYQLASNGA